jgi:transposase
LLWEEYAEQHSKSHYSYSRFTVLYRAWFKKQRISMRQVHRAGEKLVVDYAGLTLKIIDSTTGEERSAQVFVCVLGMISYTYAEATLPDWIEAHTLVHLSFTVESLRLWYPIILGVRSQRPAVTIQS